MAQENSYSLDRLETDLRSLGIQPDNDGAFRFRPGMVVEACLSDGDSWFAIFVANGERFYRMVVLDEQGNGCLREVPISHCALTQVNGHWGLEGLIAVLGENSLQGEESILLIPPKLVPLVTDIKVLVHSLGLPLAAGTLYESSICSREAVCETLYTRREELTDLQRASVLERLAAHISYGMSPVQLVSFARCLERWVRDASPSEGWTASLIVLVLKQVYIGSRQWSQPNELQACFNGLCISLDSLLMLRVFDELLGSANEVGAAVLEACADRWGRHQPREVLLSYVGRLEGRVRYCCERSAQESDRQLRDRWGKFMAECID